MPDKTAVFFSEQRLHFCPAFLFDGLFVSLMNHNPEEYPLMTSDIFGPFFVLQISCNIDKTYIISRPTHGLRPWPTITFILTYLALSNCLGFHDPSATELHKYLHTY